MTWGANIMPIDVLSGCSGAVAHLASGIIWAADHDADVINVSLQFYLDPILNSAAVAVLEGAVNYAHDLGAVLIGAAAMPATCVPWP